MSKFRTSILIVGMLVIIVAASLLTVFALYMTGSIVTDRIELVFAVLDAEKEYDGSPLVPEHYKLVTGDLLEGHYALVEFEGSQTDAGMSKSGLSVKIYDEKDFDVTGEYKIAVNRGDLKVTPKAISVVLNDEEVVYCGTKVSFEDYTVTTGELVAGHKIAGSQNAQLITVNDTLPSDLKPVVYDMAGKDVTRNYTVNFTMGEVRVVPRPLAVKPADTIKFYDGEEVSLGQVEIISGSLAEGQYFKNIEINYGITSIEAGVCDKVIRITKIGIFQQVGSKETEVTENYDLDYMSETGVVRIEKRPLTIAALSMSWEYDGGEHDLMSNHDFLSCEGLAPGEQLLEVDYSGSITDAGEATNFISKLYFSDGASEDNYEINYIYGKLTITKRNITIITPTVTKVYDGTPLKGNEDNASPTGVNIYRDHKIVPDEEGIPELTECGTIPNELTCRIVNKDDASRKDLSQNYNITYYYGTITVTPRPLYVVTPDVSAAFDGTTHYGVEDVEELEHSNLLDTHKIVIAENANVSELDEVGKILNEVDLAVKDAEDKDISKNYAIIYQLGYLEITPLEVTITTAGRTRVYNAEKLQLGEGYTDFGELASLSALKCVLTENKNNYPSITDVGSVRNFAEYILKYEDERAVNKKNYSIAYEYGMLEITPYTVNLTLNPFNKVYDSQEFEFDEKRFAEALEGNEDCFDYELFPRAAVKLQITEGVAVNAGSYTYTAALAAEYQNGNFVLEYTDGIITIEKFVVEIDDLPTWSEGSAETEKVYNMRQQLPEIRDVLDYTYLTEWFTYEDLELIAVEGDFTNADDGLHYYTVQLKDRGNEDNIEVICEPGSLKIIPCPVTVKLKKYEIDYDAQVHSPSMNDILVVRCDITEIQTNRSKYLEPYCAETIKDAKEYDYEVRFKDGEVGKNYRIVLSADSPDGKYIINKIIVNVEPSSANIGKTYDRTQYAVTRQDIRVTNRTATALGYTYDVVNAVTDSAKADGYTVNIKSDNLKFYYNGEDISGNFTLFRDVRINVEIRQKSISFVLENYFCNSNTKPRELSDELKSCLRVSSLTPLFDGYYIEFDINDVMDFNYSRNTLSVDIDNLKTYLKIYDEKGRDVTENFVIANEEDMTSAIIVID